MSNDSPPAYSLTWVTDQLAVGAAPMSQPQLDSLHEQGVSAIMNLCGEFCDLHDIECGAGFDVYYMPLEDEEAPELTELEKGLGWLDEALYLGKKVLIHCRHGIGRTGTVLNAYLLRRGLGHKEAWRRLKKLRSKPANFAQWWTIRKYGRKSGRLTLREPSLEVKRTVDLSPFFKDYTALTERTEDLFNYELGDRGRCGRDHDMCSRTPITLTLIEAIYLTNRINTLLTSEQRMEAIERAVKTAQLERETARNVGEGDYCLSEADAVCPLLADGKCLIYEHRPLQCRSFELDPQTKTDFWGTVLAPALETLSMEAWLAYTGTLATSGLTGFPLADVVSGRYVQAMFHLMMESGAV